MTPSRKQLFQWRASRLWLRLLLGFGSLVGLMLVVVAIAVTQFRSLALQSEQLARTDLQRMLAVQQIDQHAQGHGSSMARLLTASRSERETIYPEVDAEYAAVEQLIGSLAAQTFDPTSSDRLRQVADRRNAYRSAFIEVGEALETGDAESARKLFNRNGQPALKALMEAANALLIHEQAAMQRRQVEVQAQIRQSEWLLAALAAGAVWLAAMVGWRITRSVVRPLQRIEAAANQIADGNYNVQFRVRSGDELDKVAAAINAMSAAVAAREARIEELAFTESRTGLPNRTRLRQLFDGDNPRRLSVLLMDVARLRNVNEILGFETGDALMADIAVRLRLVVMPSTGAPPARVLAALGGGVFAVVCTGHDRAAIDQLRQQVDVAMAAPFDCKGHQVDVQLSFGMADCPSAHVDVDVVLRHAETALGQAKESKLPWAWHVPVDEPTRARQLGLLSDLRAAAADGQLEMWLQPKQCLRTGRTCGMEALVRWHHPERGYVSPAEFVPFAERTGNLPVITHAMIDAALACLGHWHGALPELTISVNVGTRDVHDIALVHLIERLAQQHAAPVDRLCLEITESSVMEDADSVLPVLHALRGVGVRLSIDDFGTGYSSLAYLQRLPVSELKIDRSFIADADLKADARTLLKTIVDLGHSLQMHVTAEGIERSEELALVAELGCDLAQGYLIGRPMAPAVAERFFEALAAATPAQGQRRSTRPPNLLVVDALAG
ncbi:putative bifunctional diguanylate cyclase/phosphodiesterase [Piscinibacter sakaiensis]|uniref:putative bifunctional diguanylate cyclase/phosphodiesterase n=1 Tax=Piscinibacter sakaiensis TaxID=1547922 RepID=UPI003AAA7F34